MYFNIRSNICNGDHTSVVTLSTSLKSHGTKVRKKVIQSKYNVLIKYFLFLTIYILICGFKSLSLYYKNKE